jgi:hypothetical protein
VSDVAPQNTALFAQSASPLGSTNKTGAFLNLAGGWGTIQSTAVQANCGAADTLTLTWLNQDNTAGTKTCTEDAALDDSTHFTCGSDNQTFAVKVAACLATATGIAACGGTACTTANNGFNGTSGIIYVYPASNEPAVLTAKLVSSGNHAVVTLGTPGNVLFPGKLYLGTDARGTIAASTTYLDQCLANTICTGTPASGDEAGAFLSNQFYVRASAVTKGSWGGTTLDLTSDSTMRFFNAVNFGGSADTSISRSAANTVAIGTGANGSVAGTIAANVATIGSTLTAASTTNIGWSVVSGANTACNTTCTFACVFGIDTGSTTNSLLACTDATADLCLCAGAN